MSTRNDHWRDLRRRIHARPELGFEERATAELVAQQLRALGLEVTTGIGGTGVVASLRKGTSTDSIGLRADMDALPIQEQNTFGHRSRVDGVFHGCGHDGHTTMLLAAAESLARDARFNGTVHLIFQPAEEGLGGARAMMDDGLFTHFPCRRIFGLHNMPRIAAGTFAVRAGAYFAGASRFHVTVHGCGGHAAMPHRANDPVVVAAHVVTALQTLVSRNADPLQSAVVTVAAIHAGDAHNVIPASAELQGTVRYLDRAVGALLERRFREVVGGIAAAFAMRVEIDYRENFPVLVNHAAETELAVAAARSVAGDNVDAQAVPIMGSEDFAAMLEQVPGCYILIGNGGGAEACMIHNPNYDFNDAIIPAGAAWWTRLAELALPA